MRTGVPAAKQLLEQGRRHLRHRVDDRHDLGRRLVTVADPLVKPGIPGVLVVLAEVRRGVHGHPQDVLGPPVEHLGLRVQLLQLADVLGQPLARDERP